jgi:hypothetical protein
MIVNALLSAPPSLGQTARGAVYYAARQVDPAAVPAGCSPQSYRPLHERQSAEVMQGHAFSSKDLDHSRRRRALPRRADHHRGKRFPEYEFPAQHDQQEAEKLKMGYTFAWTIWPQIVHVHGFRIEGTSKKDRGRSRSTTSTIKANLYELTQRQFHA